MTAATPDFRFVNAGGVFTIGAAILLIFVCHAFARSVCARFSFLGVVHFPLLPCLKFMVKCQFVEADSLYPVEQTHV